jgi:hypothetical protein
MRFPDRDDVWLEPGELLVVPRGVEHQPSAPTAAPWPCWSAPRREHGQRRRGPHGRAPAASAPEHPGHGGEAAALSACCAGPARAGGDLLGPQAPGHRADSSGARPAIFAPRRSEEGATSTSPRLRSIASRTASATARA